MYTIYMISMEVESGKSAAYNTTSLPWEYCVMAERGGSKNDESCVVFCALKWSRFLNAEWLISVWDYVKLSNNKSRMLNAIRIIKMWLERLSTGYRLLLEEFSAEVEQIWFGIRLLKNCEHDGDDFTCEYNDRMAEQQYSIATSLVFCLFATKYVIELKDLNTRYCNKPGR